MSESGRQSVLLRVPRPSASYLTYAERPATQTPQQTCRVEHRERNCTARAGLADLAVFVDINTRDLLGGAQACGSGAFGCLDCATGQRARPVGQSAGTTGDG